GRDFHFEHLEISSANEHRRLVPRAFSRTKQEENSEKLKPGGQRRQEDSESTIWKACTLAAGTTKTVSISDDDLRIGSWHMLIEPANHPIHDVAPVVGLLNRMPFTGIDYKLSLHSQCLQCMPEFARLRRRAFTIPFAH